jgi:sugar PTS system EIIA component
MFEKLFGKKEKVTEDRLVASTNGKVVAIENVPDPTFSEKMMGDGIAIDPIDGKVTAPMDAEVIQVFPTKHAIGLKGKSGIELLIHIGLETVSMNGEGFEVHVKAGDKVKTGQSLVTFDLDLIKEKAASTMIPLVITNMDVVESLEKSAVGNDAVAGETLLLTVKTK